MSGNKKNRDSKKILISQFNPESRFSEQYRIIRTNIQFSSGEEKLQSIVVTSAGHSEGKTTTVANLGTVMAQQGKKVLLIDADFQKPALHQFFEKNNHSGLTNILMSDYSLGEVVMNTPVKNLYIMTSGSLPPIDSDLLGSKRMSLFMGKVKEMYDIILIDSPPIIESANAQVLANICDGLIIVMKSGKTKKDEVAIARNNLINCKAKLLGAVLNEKLDRKRSLFSLI